ncbi:MAG: metallophosphoesterase [bacterium]|nr:metallophosphoesterase [bacterium]
MRRMVRVLAFVFAACLLLAGVRAPAADAPVAARWLVVSDVHFDPFADRHLTERLAAEPVNRWRDIFQSGVDRRFAGYGSDTNDALLESVLDAMHDADPDPGVVFIDGDFLAHGFREKFDRSLARHDDIAYAAFVDKTISFLSREFQLAFPRARILPVIGNNDNICGDYESTPSSPFLAHVAAEFAIATGASDPNAFSAQFATGGYYVASLPVAGAQALVLNDVMWSARYRNACGIAGSDPGGDELAWLQKTLPTLHGPVWVFAHIPPGIDVYSTLRARDGAPVSFLAQRYNDALIAALDGSAPRVTIGIFGHTHMSSFAVGGASAPMTPLLEVPSVSPIFGNNPSFTILDVDGNANVTDEDVVTLNNLGALAKNGRLKAVWRRDYAFDSIYGRGILDAAHLAAAQARIFSDERVRKRFVELYDGDAPGDPMPDGTWRAYWCGGVALEPVAYQACSMPQIQTALPTHPPAPPPPSPTPSASPIATP